MGALYGEKSHPSPGGGGILLGYDDKQKRRASGRIRAIGLLLQSKGVELEVCPMAVLWKRHKPGLVKAHTIAPAHAEVKQ